MTAVILAIPRSLRPELRRICRMLGARVTERGPVVEVTTAGDVRAITLRLARAQVQS